MRASRNVLGTRLNTNCLLLGGVCEQMANKMPNQGPCRGSGSQVSLGDY